MAAFYLTFSPDSLKTMIGVNVIIPQKKHIRCVDSPAIEGESFQSKYPVLILLHDEASSPEELIRATKLEQYAEEKNIMIVLPDGMRSFYKDYYAIDPGYPVPGVHYSNPEIEAKFTELRFEKYLINDVLAIVQNAFPASAKKEDTYIGGIGMGGFGAVRLAMKYQDIFSKVFSINGYLDIKWMQENWSWRKEQLDAIWGPDGLDSSDSDLPKTVTDSGLKTPDIYQLWMEGHVSEAMNENFAVSAQKRTNYRFTRSKQTTGSQYTDTSLELAIQWL